SYFYLTDIRGWKKSLTSIFFIVLSIVFIVLPLWALIDYLIAQLNSFLGNRDEIIEKFNMLKEYMADKPLLRDIDMSDAALLTFIQNLTRYVPSILNSVAEVAINIIVTLFVLYFMQVHAKKMEITIYRAIPFSRISKQEIWDEVNMMVRSNALGIPILGFFQGIVAMIGYWIFGVESYILLGLMTGIASIIPISRLITVYVPSCLIAFSIWSLGNAIGFTLFCFLLVLGIVHILRVSILQTIANDPPMITVFVVLLGLNLFCMLAPIFGPLR